MKFEQLIKDRYSCRKFKNTPVEKEKIEKILEAALVAPTACNLQPQRILVLTDKNIIKALDDEKCTRYTFDAPLIFVMCVDRSKAWTRKYDGISSAEVDSSIAMTQMMLQAQELGLGTTWVMALNPDIAKKVLNIPENLDVISLVFLYILFKFNQIINCNCSDNYTRRNTDSHNYCINSVSVKHFTVGIYYSVHSII